VEAKKTKSVAQLGLFDPSDNGSDGNGTETKQAESKRGRDTTQME
jgi:hypothetical protein